MSLEHNSGVSTEGLHSLYDFKNKKSYNPSHNLVSHSRYNATTWTLPFGASATLTPGIKDPFGGTEAVRLTGTSSQYLLRTMIPSFTPNGISKYTISFYARLVSGSVSLFADLNDGMLSSNYFSQLVTNQWVRIQYTGIPTATAKTFIDIVNNVFTPITIDFYGLQLEQNEYATDLINTNGSIVPKSTIVYDIAKKNNHLTVYGSPQLDQEGYLKFADNQITEYLMNSKFNHPARDFSYNFWFRSRFTGPTQTPLAYSINGDNHMMFFIPSPTELQPHVFNSSAWRFFTDNMTNLWVNITWTRSAISGESRIYRNGTFIASNIRSPNQGQTNFGYFIVGQETDLPGGGFDPLQNLDGDISYIAVYDKALSESEVKKNFNVVKRRYGL
jgi:hypothetical protein